MTFFWNSVTSFCKPLVAILKIRMTLDDDIIKTEKKYFILFIILSVSNLKKYY